MPPSDTLLPWLKRAKLGDRRVYHVGNAASESPRVAVDNGDPKCVPKYPQLSELAWRAYEAGLVWLFQKRLASHKFEYIVIRTRKSVGSDDELFALAEA
jgi:hypothetical protein